MHYFNEIYETIKQEIVYDDVDVRMHFLNAFRGDVDHFINYMAKAYLRWKEFDDDVRGDLKKALVSALTYTAIHLNIIAMKLFLSGYLVASGNLQRDTLETIALALLCSCNSLDIAERFDNNEYSTQKAIKHVKKYANEINLNKDALDVLQKAQKFYHSYSHPSKMTLASVMSLSGEGLYVGSSFDESKA